MKQNQTIQINMWEGWVPSIEPWQKAQQDICFSLCQGRGGTLQHLERLRSCGGNFGSFQMVSTLLGHLHSCEVQPQTMEGLCPGGVPSHTLCRLEWINHLHHRQHHSPALCPRRSRMLEEDMLRAHERGEKMAITHLYKNHLPQRSQLCRQRQKPTWKSYAEDRPERRAAWTLGRAETKAESGAHVAPRGKAATPPQPSGAW